MCQHFLFPYSGYHLLKSPMSLSIPGSTMVQKTVIYNCPRNLPFDQRIVRRCKTKLIACFYRLHIHAVRCLIIIHNKIRLYKCFVFSMSIAGTRIKNGLMVYRSVQQICSTSRTVTGFGYCVGQPTTNRRYIYKVTTNQSHPICHCIFEPFVGFLIDRPK